ncbi:MAG TPA: MIP family channel protein [Vicinamibacterales bacterium]|nr:MIP family channel protein [Vicinamibacterales bacterium]
MTERTASMRRELLAEFLATFVLIAFGVGVVAQVVLSEQTAGTFLTINFAWGLGVTMGCYVAGGVSGAHMNPAVTLALALHRGFPWRKVLPYTAAQMAGAFAASAVVYVTYLQALGAFDGGVRQVLGPQGTGGIWATYPQPFLSTFPGGFIDQVVGTALLVGVIFAISDGRNVPPPAGVAPLLVGLLVAVIGMSFGFNAGYAINPARDFAPRVFTAIAGWGAEVFRAGNAWWWVPVVAPCVGGALGGWIYDVCVGRHLSVRTQSTPDSHLSTSKSAADAAVGAIEHDAPGGTAVG